MVAAIVEFIKAGRCHRSLQLVKIGSAPSNFYLYQVYGNAGNVLWCCGVLCCPCFFLGGVVLFFVLYSVQSCVVLCCSVRYEDLRAWARLRWIRLSCAVISKIDFHAGSFYRSIKS